MLSNVIALPIYIQFSLMTNSKAPITQQRLHELPFVGLILEHKLRFPLTIITRWSMPLRTLLSAIAVDNPIIRTAVASVVIIQIMT